MAFSERIRLIIDVAAGNATSTLSRLRTEFNQADGAFAKMQVAGRNAFDFVERNAALLATAAVPAIAGFATKAVSEFQKVALGAGELRDALGVSAEEASRLQEVAGDVGVSTEALQAAIGRMNRSAADTPGVFDAAGAAIVRNGDGTINVTETFIAAAEALRQIPDAAERAARGQEIFGRGWMNVSELIMSGADGIREAMESVEGGKIIDDDEIERARQFRDTMDQIKGIVEQTVVETGNLLTSAMAGADRLFTELLNPFDDDNTSGSISNLATLIGLTEELRANLAGLPSVTGTFDLDSARGLTDYAAALAEVGVEATFANGALIVNGEVLKSIPWVGSAADIARYNEALSGGADATERALEAAQRSESVHREHFAALEDTAAAAEAAAAAERDLADAARGQAAAISAATNARRAAADAQFAANEATRQFQEQLAAVTEEFGEAGQLSTDYAAAMERTALAAADVADAQLRIADETATANGVTLTAVERGDIWRDSMIEQAAAAQGPLRDAILGYIGDVEGIPDEKMTEIVAAVAAGDLETAQRLLDEASEKRTAEIQAEALTATADGTLKTFTSQRRSTTVDVVLGDTPSAQGIANKIGVIRVPVDAYVRSTPRVTGIRNRVD